nr:NUDIX pyrophosphatase [uncultured Roseateles sp.]
MSNSKVRAPFQVLVVPFRLLGVEPEFAILKRSDMHVWQFVAGGGDQGESPQQAAIREANEELGLTLNSVIDLQTRSSIPAKFFKARTYWPKDLYVVPEYSFAIDCSEANIMLSHEHIELKWECFENADSLLNWDSNKTALWELNERLLQTNARPSGSI